MAVTGADGIKRALKGQELQYRRALLGALLAEGYDIMAKSIPLVPVEFSLLRNSRYVGIPGGAVAARMLDRPFVELGYGTDYAISVHEKHEVSHRVGQSNYLRQPYNAAQGGMRQRIADRTRLFHRLGVGPVDIPREAPAKPKVGTRPKKKRKANR